MSCLFANAQHGDTDFVALMVKRPGRVPTSGIGNRWDGIGGA